MNVVILGCGRTGAALAYMLSAANHKVSLIEWNPSSLRRLDPRFHGQTIIGSGLDQDILERAGIKQADLFAALTEGDNRNLMAAQIAKHRYGVKSIVAKVNDPFRAERYRSEEIFTICYGVIGASMIKSVLDGEDPGNVQELNLLTSMFRLDDEE